MGIVMLARHPINDMGREQVINVWISPPRNWTFSKQADNNDLSILLALQLQRNWHGRINLCMAVANEEEQQKASDLLSQLITQARLPGNTQPVILISPFVDALTTAPRADLTVIGLPKEPDLSFNRKIMDIVDGSCVFVRDSGEESALA
jgi:hypothetical protein